MNEDIRRPLPKVNEDVRRPLPKVNEDVKSLSVCPRIYDEINYIIQKIKKFTLFKSQ